MTRIPLVRILEEIVGEEEAPRLLFLLTKYVYSLPLLKLHTEHEDGVTYVTNRSAFLLSLGTYLARKTVQSKRIKDGLNALLRR